VASIVPDWTAAEEYRWLLTTERCGFAWEWLRRDARYQIAARGAHMRSVAGIDENSPKHWNLHRFEDPALSYPEARPLWTGPTYPWVAKAQACSGGHPAQALDLPSLAPSIKSIRNGKWTHLLLSDGHRSIRLDVRGLPEARPVILEFHLKGLGALDHQLVVLQRLRSLAISGRFAGSLYPPVSAAARLILQLRAFDALQQGASQRDLAHVLLPASFGLPGWRIRSPSVRSQAQRLAKAARRMAAGNYWRLLR
jgi:hypothetical protein